MNQSKTFTLEEATRMLPKLKQMLTDANLELSELADRLEREEARFELIQGKIATAERSLDQTSDPNELRTVRREFEGVIQSLSEAKHSYLDCIERWLEKIGDSGVILRDIRTGLLDFPARQGEVDYYLCWTLNESDIGYWHLVNDGFVGRRPLAVLAEYF